MLTACFIGRRLCVALMMATSIVCLPATAGAWAEDPATQPKVIQPESAGDHVGETCTIEMQVRSARRGDSPICFLNSETDFRNAKNFTAVILEGGLARFKASGIELPEKHFEGRKVRVTGKIESYRGRPQIRLEDPKQIEIVKDPPDA